jgi:hypothetical protein
VPRQNKTSTAISMTSSTPASSKRPSHRTITGEVSPAREADSAWR